MPYYRVLLHGANIRIEPENKSALHLASSSGANPIVGFYTTRIIQAPDKECAVVTAIRSADDELAKLGFDKINAGDVPVYSPEQVERIGLLPYLFAKPRRGFTFYSE